MTTVAREYRDSLYATLEKVRTASSIDDLLALHPCDRDSLDFDTIDDLRADAIEILERDIAEAEEEAEKEADAEREDEARSNMAAAILRLADMIEAALHRPAMFRRSYLSLGIPESVYAAYRGITIRVSDHDQTVLGEGRKACVVGGYSEERGERHDAAEVSFVVGDDLDAAKIRAAVAAALLEAR